MENLGYEKNKFNNYKGNNFDCLICFNVAKQPKEC